VRNFVESKSPAAVNAITKISSEMRNTEMAILDIDKAKGEVMALKDVEWIIDRICTVLKTEIRSMPYKVAEKTCAELGFNDPARLAAILLIEIDDALRHLSKLRGFINAR
jgi:GTP1/Obg family GTP-binding protein